MNPPSRPLARCLAASSLLALWPALAQAADTPPAKLDPIQKIEVGPGNEFRVNGKPFIPLVSWLQKGASYPRLRELGFNVFMGNWKNIPPANEMADLAQQAGGYAIPHFNGVGAGHPAIFGWIQEDEPDITSKVSDAVVTPAPGLIVNKGAPLTAMVDGSPKTSAVIDPMAGASFTVELKSPVTVGSLAATLVESKDNQLAQPSEIRFLGDGKELLKATLEPKSAQQKFTLSAPATFQKLEVRVTASTPGKMAWGRIAEIEAFSEKGENLLKSEPYAKVRSSPEEVVAHYRAIKAADPGRPVWLTTTCRFLPRYEQWHKLPVEQMRPLYPKWVEGCDAFGTDIYPIYGFGKPEWLLDNVEALVRMRELAGPKKPLYIWIETCNGGEQQGATAKVEPKHTRAEVWMSLIAGARGIGYFTHAWKPSFTDFACDEAMQAELKRLNTQVTRLTEAICAPPAKAKTSIALEGGLRGHLMANDAADARYLFAQNLNLEGKSAKATIAVEGLKAGTKIEVVDEGRTVVAGDGAFEDTFEALAEHIYRIARP